VTLNAVDHTQIRSVDRETLDSPAPHSQIQARKAASITEFGLDVDQDLLRAVTGIPREKELGKRLTGKDALRTTGPLRCIRRHYDCENAGTGVAAHARPLVLALAAVNGGRILSREIRRRCTKATPQCLI
jgi:uncharacterized protein (TIGR04141 family)